MNVGEYIRRNAQQHPDGCALIDRGRRITHREYDQRVNRVANALLGLGARTGDRLAVLADNSALVLEVYGAAAKAGLRYVPVNFRVSPHELAEIVSDCRPTVLVVGEGYRDRLDEVDTMPSAARPIVLNASESPPEGDRRYEDELTTASVTDPAVEVTGDLGLTLVYTSGTTGVLKAVEMTHDQTVAHALCSVVEYELRGDSRYLLVLPHTSAGSVHNTFPECLMVAATLVLDDVKRFSAERFLRNVEEHHITHTHIVPTMAFRILDHPEASAYDLSSLQTVGYGGAPTPASQVERLMELFGPIVIDVYGMTEVGATATVLRKEHHARFAAEGRLDALASAGVPAHGIEVRPVRADHSACDVDEVGEIALRGPYVMTDYWPGSGVKLPGIFTDDGWLLSGDMGRVDSEGFLYVVDRKKDIIISGGLNVASREVEDALYSHPGVATVAVVGVPDPEWGEAVHAVVVRHGVVSAEELQAHCVERLADYKVPKAVHFVDDLPKNTMGKIVKPDVRAWLAQQAGVA